MTTTTVPTTDLLTEELLARFDDAPVYDREHRSSRKALTSASSYLSAAVPTRVPGGLSFAG
jgi:hypothetical protein